MKYYYYPVGLRGTEGDYVAALAGNPNTGKSTVFNALTGLNQHTGNWPGKTVAQARGYYRHRGKTIVVVDLPGTYSLSASSLEEEVARDFICFGQPDVTVVVTDATCLERNLNLVLQILEITPKVVVCLNLMDEAERKGLKLDVNRLAHELGVPVVPTTAHTGRGIEQLKDRIHSVALGEILPRPKPVTYSKQLEEAIHQLETSLERIHTNGISRRWIALRLLEGDYSILDAIGQYSLPDARQEG
ncbi:MAG: iron transporter FeoB [Firmicutes bacterium]|nr:iron transporter FeoB [Bacillota bacterium]